MNTNLNVQTADSLNSSAATDTKGAHDNAKGAHDNAKGAHDNGQSKQRPAAKAKGARN